MKRKGELRMVAEAVLGNVDWGKTYAKVSCPFHSDRNPSLVLYPNDNFWKCFSCGAKGNDIELLVRLWGLNVPQAKQWIERNR